MTDLIARLEELEKAATPGPWEPEGVGGLHMDGTRDGYVICSAPERRIASLYPTTTNRLVRRFDAALIAELRAALPAILHALKVQEAAEEWEMARKKFMDGVAVGLVEQNVTDRLVETEAALVRTVKGEQP